MNAIVNFIADARYSWRRMDPLVRTIIANWILGVAVGQVCVALLLGFDFFGIRSLLWRSDVTSRGRCCFARASRSPSAVSSAPRAVMTFDADRDPTRPRGGLRQWIGPRLRLRPDSRRRAAHPLKPGANAD